MTLAVLRSMIVRDGIVPLRVLCRALDEQFTDRVSFDAGVTRLVSVGWLDMVYGEGFEPSIRLNDMRERPSIV